MSSEHQPLRQADDLRTELRELLSAFLDAEVLVGHTLTRDQWERACLLSGRYERLFLDHLTSVSD